MSYLTSGIKWIGPVLEHMGLRHHGDWNPSFTKLPEQRLNKTRMWIIGRRGGAMVGCRTLDREVTGSIRVGAELSYDSGQVVHTHLPRCRQSSLLYGVVEPGTFYLNSHIAFNKRVTCNKSKPILCSSGHCNSMPMVVFDSQLCNV